MAKKSITLHFDNQDLLELYRSANKAEATSLSNFIADVLKKEMAFYPDVNDVDVLNVKEPIKKNTRALNCPVSKEGRDVIAYNARQYGLSANQYMKKLCLQSSSSILSLDTDSLKRTFEAMHDVGEKMNMATKYCNGNGVKLPRKQLDSFVTNCAKNLMNLDKEVASLSKAIESELSKTIK